MIGSLCEEGWFHFFITGVLSVTSRRRVILHARSLIGGCGAHAIMGRISVGIGRKRVIKLLNPGKTKGAAAFCVAMKLIAPGRKGVFLGSVRVAGFPICGHTHGNVNCLTRRTSVFHGVAIRSGVHSMLRVARAASRCRGRGLRDLVTRFNLGGIQGGLNSRLSKNRHQHTRVTHYLTVSPGFVVLSRPFTKMSPVTMRSVRDVITGLGRGGVKVLVASRGMCRALDVYSHTCLLFRKGILFRKATRRLTRGRVIHRGCLNGSFILHGGSFWRLELSSLVVFGFQRRQAGGGGTAVTAVI